MGCLAVLENLLLPEMDAGMKKLLPVVEALIEKAEASELHAMRSVA